MPRMRGSQLANVVAKRWPNLPVVLVTGYAEMREGANKDLLRLPRQPTPAQLGEIVVKAVMPTSVASWHPAIWELVRLVTMRAAVLTLLMVKLRGQHG